MDTCQALGMTFLYTSNYNCKVSRWDNWAINRPSHWFLILALSGLSKLNSLFPFPKQVTEIEPAGRLDSSGQDRLTALEAVANFGAPIQVFDSEGECLQGVLMGALPDNGHQD